MSYRAHNQVPALHATTLKGRALVGKQRIKRETRIRDVQERTGRLFNAGKGHI
jgi:hypothetical protein